MPKVQQQEAGKGLHSEAHVCSGAAAAVFFFFFFFHVSSAITIQKPETERCCVPAAGVATPSSRGALLTFLNSRKLRTVLYQIHRYTMEKKEGEEERTKPSRTKNLCTNFNFHRMRDRSAGGAVVPHQQLSVSRREEPCPIDT